MRSWLVRRLPKLLWAAMIGLHLPILAMVIVASIIDGPNLDRLSSIAALAAALAFFVLKLNDVSFLRLRSGQQAIIAFGLLVAIGHYGAIERQLGEDAAPVAAADRPSAPAWSPWPETAERSACGFGRRWRAQSAVDCGPCR